MKILIVDDETIIREWLQYTMESFTFDSIQADLASDGVSALEKIAENHYDILFIDIQMPRMNGLELLKKIQDSGKKIITVILSSHSDFDYAREAMKYETLEYVLKSECSKESLEKLLKKCKAQLNQHISNAGQFRSRYLCHIFHKETAPDLGKNENLLFPELKNQPYCCIAIQHDRGIYFHTSIFREELFGNNWIYLGENDGVLYYLVTSDNSGVFSDIPHLAEDPLAQFCEKHPNILISCSRCYSSTAHIQTAIFDACHTLNQIFYRNRNYGVCLHNQGEAQPQEIDSLCTDIINHICHYDNAKLFPSLRKLNEQILKTMPDILFVKNTYVNILYSLYLYHCKDTGKLPQIMESFKERILSFQHFSNLTDYVFSIVRQYILTLPTSKICSPHIETALTFISENYATINSVSDISKAIYLNPDYLTRLFKKETGKNLSAYLMEYKLNIASYMLRTTHLQISDIATKVGIDNISYFSRKFKEQFGIQPILYRNMNQE